MDTPARVGRPLDAGLVSINGWANIAVEFEEGGYKASGFGGMASMEDFLEYKQIAHAFAGGHHQGVVRELRVLS